MSVRLNWEGGMITDDTVPADGVHAVAFHNGVFRVTFFSPATITILTFSSSIRNLSMAFSSVSG
jgi:hypothetical protein